MNLVSFFCKIKHKMAYKHIVPFIAEEVNKSKLRVAFINGDNQYGSRVTFYKVNKVEQAIPHLTQDIYDYYDGLGFEDDELPVNSTETQFKEWIEKKLRKDITHFNIDSEWELFMYISVAKDEEWEKHFEHIHETSKGPGHRFEFVDLTNKH